MALANFQMSGNIPHDTLELYIPKAQTQLKQDNIQNLPMLKIHLYLNRFPVIRNKLMVTSFFLRKIIRPIITLHVEQNFQFVICLTGHIQHNKHAVIIV